MGFRGVAVVCFAFCLGVSPSASAWTKARVRDVRAEIDVASDGSAGVLLDLGVEVQGGWLERLDLEGLDEDLVLDDREPAWLVTDLGSRVVAKAEASGGAITLRFAKQAAARRGLHRVHVRYRAPFAHASSGPAGERQQIPWVLPGWEDGLTQAQIVVRGPPALRLVRDPALAVEVHERAEGGRSVVELTRLLVPRMTPWAIVLDVPASWSGDVPASASAPHVDAPSESAFNGALSAACVLGFGFLSRRSFRARAQGGFVATRPLIRSERQRRGLALSCTLLAAWGGVFSTPLMVAALLTLGFCFFDVVVVEVAPIPLGRFAPLSRADRERLRRDGRRVRLGGLPWADGSTLVGAIGALLLLGGSVFAARTNLGLGLGLLCALPYYASSSRLRLPRPMHEQVALLLGAAKRSLALSCAMRVVAFANGEGELVAPRLRVVTATRFTGLVRLDVGVDTRRDRPGLVLIAVTQPGSVADQALIAHDARFLRVLSPQGHRAAHMLPVEELGAALESVLSCLAAHSQLTVERMDARQAA